jgi:hypothetical protein
VSPTAPTRRPRGQSQPGAGSHSDSPGEPGEPARPTRHPHSPWRDLLAVGERAGVPILEGLAQNRLVAAYADFLINWESSVRKQVEQSAARYFHTWNIPTWQEARRLREHMDALSHRVQSARDRNDRVGAR